MISGRSRLLLAIVSVTALFAVLVPDSALAQDDDMMALFERGKEAFYRGEYDEALQTFQSLLAENPSNETAFYFWEQAGHKIFLDMLIREGEFEKVARRFIEKARVGRKAKEEDSARIAELTDMLVSGDHRQRREALLELQSNHGEYAVESLYRELNNDDIEARVNVIAALFRMGEEATLPLVQVLESEDPLVQRNTAIILGKIKDSRAVAALKKLYDDGSTDSTVGDAAEHALNVILGQDMGGLDAASQLYSAMAEAYLKGDAKATKPLLPSRVIWQWRNGELIKLPVLPGLRNLELAEDACYDALECDSGNIQALNLLTAVYAMQLAEMAAMGEGEDFGVDEDALMFAKESIAKADAILALSGADRLQDGLAFALENNLNLAAVEILKVMEKTHTLTDGALSLAFSSGDKLVGYAAASAAVSCDLVTSNVVGILARALGETSVRQVLVIDENPETLNALVTGLNSKGFFAVGAANGIDGLLRAKNFPPKDLVIASATLSDMTLDKIVFEIQSGMTSETPVVVLAADRGMDQVQELWDGKVAGFLTYSEVQSGAYAPVVQEFSGEMNSARQKAIELSISAAKSLSMLNGLMLNSIVEDLIQALDKPDEVRINVLGALVKVGDRTALEPVARVFMDSSVATEVRVAAAKALGAIFAAGQAAPDGELLSSLQEALAGDEPALRLAAAGAIGKASNLLDTEDLVQMLVANRIQ